MSQLSFIAFCVEHYAEYTHKTGPEIYKLFNIEGLLNMLKTDYEDLHGMGLEYLMQFFDEYLGGKR